MSRGAYIAMVAFLALMLAMAVVEVCHAQPGSVHKRHNAYYPYSVETVILDK